MDFTGSLQTSYLQEFLTIALLHFLAVASPGPDFAVVTRYSLRHGRRVGLWVSLGIGTGILVHVTYSLLGVALIIHRYEWVYLSLLVVGALYLGFLGSQAIRSTPRNLSDLPGEGAVVRTARTDYSNSRAFGVGFLTNGLNVKATLFFLALFSTVIAPSTPNAVKAGYGLYMAVATAGWFCLLSYAMTWGPFYQRLWRYSHWLDRLMGAALLFLSFHLLLEAAERFGFI